MTDNYLIIITGPTAIGKTKVALDLNNIIGSSIISADSRQVYKEMSIGTAKPSAEEILHGNIKLVDHISVRSPYNAGRFALEANEIIENDFNNNRHSIICGGTGLYISAITEGLHDFPEIDPKIREALNETYKSEGIEELSKELETNDPEYYNQADVQNPRRIIRALEVIRQSGRKYSDFTSKEKSIKKYKTIEIILELPRQELYDKINHRVDLMIESGLIDEVKTLIPFRKLKALQTVGYSEVFKYLDGEYSLEQCIEEIKKNSRRYAKRQITWLSKYDTNHRFHPEDFNSIRDYLKSSGLNKI